MDTSTIVIFLCIYLLLAGIPAALAFEVLSRIPKANRKQAPGLAFLLLIPIFSVVWVFYVHPKVAESLRSYHISAGNHSVGDCGASVALWLCISTVCSHIPLVGVLAAVAALALLIVFYVQAFSLSGNIPEEA
jgi:divalent metal cation (Fe/Co/Zn/Cd) transporter